LKIKISGRASRS